MTRADFPILQRTVHGGKPWIYLDNAATTQKPQAVIDAVSDFYTWHNSNVHRGAHTVSAEATAMYEASRETVKDFLNAARTEEIIFTQGTTESINLVASSWGGANLAPGDEVLVTDMEHHANIVPWYMICERTGAVLKHVPIHDDGSLDLAAAEEMMTERTKMFAFTHVSNTTGVINPARELCAMARQRGITTLVDGAQAVAHFAVDVQVIDCDFYVFSGHKVYGPTGIGVLYGKYHVLDAMPPYQGGGAMIKDVTFEKITYNDVPTRFETGTPSIAGAVGLRASLQASFQASVPASLQASLQGSQHDSLTGTLAGTLACKLAGTLTETLAGFRVLGDTPMKIDIVSFVVEGVHASDIGMLLDEQGIAVRVGHHCTMPLMRRFGVESTVRASFAFYNTPEEAEKLVDGVHKAVKMLR
ncbi:MAG: SufS family cysteine desulfurase [Ignavibacteriae bacterium]|nr:MAG: SufS family cysteine desulfurase [Ignavibacteriota bacterium]